MNKIGPSVALLVVSMMSIQFGATAAKHIFPIVGPAGTTALRSSMAFLILLAVWRPWKARFTRADFAVIAAYGAFLGLMNLAFYLAVARIPLGIAVAIEFIGPLVVALSHSRRLLDVIWAILAAVGIVLILPLTAGTPSLDPVGLVFAVASAAFWGGYIVVGRKAGKAGARSSPGVTAALGMGVAALVTVPVGWHEAGLRLFDPAVLPWGLTVAILSGALPYSLEMFALRKVPSRTFSILMSLEPAVAAVLGWLILGEHLSVLQTVAIGCVISASLGSSCFAGGELVPPSA